MLDLVLTPVAAEHQSFDQIGRIDPVAEVQLDRLDVLDVGTEALDQRQQTYIDRARPIELDELRGWSLWRRLRNNLLALAAPIL